MKDLSQTRHGSRIFHNGAKFFIQYIWLREDCTLAPFTESSQAGLPLIGSQNDNGKLMTPEYVSILKVSFPHCTAVLEKSIKFKIVFFYISDKKTKMIFTDFRLFISKQAFNNVYFYSKMTSSVWPSLANDWFRNNFTIS